MEIEIHSFRSIQELAERPFPANTTLISIGDVGQAPPTLLHRPAHILRMEFDDIDLNWLDGESSGKYAGRLFSIDQARQIAAFVARYWDGTELLICQCLGGASRSAAVAAAIRQHYFGDGMGYFADTRYRPNPYVFSLMMEALDEQKGEKKWFYKDGITWSDVGSNSATFRYFPKGCLRDNRGPGVFSADRNYVLGLLNSVICVKSQEIVNPTICFQAGSVKSVPFVDGNIEEKNKVGVLVNNNISLSRADWDSLLFKSSNVPIPR